MMHADDNTGQQPKGAGSVVSKVAMTSLASVQLVCMVIIVVSLLYLVGRRAWTIEANSSQTSLTDRLIQQRNDISRRLNKLQVSTFVGMFLVIFIHQIHGRKHTRNNN